MSNDAKVAATHDERNDAPSSEYSELIMEADYYLISGKNQFELVNIALAKAEFAKALVKANKADSLVNTSITQVKVDEINDWIKKCDSTIAAKSNITRGSKSGTPIGGSKGQNNNNNSSSSASQNGTNKDKPAGGGPTEPKVESKITENAADKYWAKYRNRVYADRKFKGSKADAHKIIALAPMLKNGTLVRPINLENAKILDSVYSASIR
jgi:hypothetical protein